MSPKRMGRPPSTDPKTDRVTVRLDQETGRVLDAYCAQEGVERADAVRKGIRKLEDDLKK